MNRIRDPTQECNHPQFFEEHSVERDFIETVQHLTRGSRRSRALDGIDSDENRVVRIAFPHQWSHRGIARVTAVPVELAVDLDGMEQGWQAR
jgi:hypothetical protein